LNLHLQEPTSTLFAEQGRIDVVRLGQGEPIVLVPGLAGSWKLVAPLARRLARDHEVILFGLRGDDGIVGAPRAASLDDYASDLAEMIRRLGLERPAVMGVSFGGAVALKLAVDRPSMLGSLIVQGAEATFECGLGARIAKGVLERFPLPMDNRFVNQFFNLLHGGRPESDTLADFVVERCWETDQSVMASRLRALESFDVSDQLWRIEVPTLVLAGTRDVVVPHARQEALADAIPGSRFRSLDGAGHIAFLTHGAETAREVTRLIHDHHPAAC
jgi:pimeloyl-ACP methyl ester carboxylesterase